MAEDSARQSELAQSELALEVFGRALELEPDASEDLSLRSAVVILRKHGEEPAPGLDVRWRHRELPIDGTPPHEGGTKLLHELLVAGYRGQLQVWVPNGDEELWDLADEDQDLE